MNANWKIYGSALEKTDREHDTNQQQANRFRYYPQKRFPRTQSNGIIEHGFSEVDEHFWHNKNIYPRLGILIAIIKMKQRINEAAEEYRQQNIHFLFEHLE